MTNTTTETTAYEAAMAAAPAWLNLSTILDDDLVNDLAAGADAIEALAETVTAGIRDALVLIHRYEDATREVGDASDAVMELLRRLTPFGRLWDTVQLIADTAGAVTGSIGDEPAWVAEMFRELRGAPRSGEVPSRPSQ